jgi:hypothetical protein
VPESLWHQEGDVANAGNEARVKEQSHKTEMRAALQGDFERLRARREYGGEAESVVDLVAANPSVNAPVARAELRPSWFERLRGRR